MPDLNGRRLINLRNLKITYGSLKHVSHVKITSIAVEDEFTQLLRSRPALTTPKFNLEAPKHSVKHYIITAGPPIKSGARRLTPSKFTAAKKEFDLMIQLGIAR